ncbi:type I-E CRISPR-associated protein Cas6/Cse3/CasE [Streptomyces sp. NPDC088775]|uniref:type I-E CRISPR-associated protein Cas6/Cse3/CasE n=1 Tax=Streptomyces sp. NPDC088775 TaxID=3365896 RepID=UPI0037F50C12
MNPLTTARFTTVRSALTLSPAEQAAGDDIHQLHALVLAGFSAPNEALPRPRGVLFAALRGAPQQDRRTRLLAAQPERILVQAPTVPHWEPLLASGRLIEAETFPVEHAFSAGDIIDIQVTANPVMRSFRTRKRVSLTAPDDASRWLQRQLAHGGLETTLDHIRPGQGIYVTGTRARSGDRITVVYRNMTARCRVLAPDTLKKALAQGLGPAKAYGCGLLRVRHVP